MITALFIWLYAMITKTIVFSNLVPIIPNLLLMGILYCLGNIFLFKGFQKAEASEVSVLFTSAGIWTVIAAIIILGDRITAVKVMGIALILSGVTVINIRKSRWQMNRGHIFALLSALCFGTSFVNDAVVLKTFTSLDTYMILVFIIPALFTLVLHPSSIRSINKLTTANKIIPITVCSLLYAIATMTFYHSYTAGGKASVISVLQQMSIVFAVCLSYVFLKERDRLLNKIVGTLLTIGGALLLI